LAFFCSDDFLPADLLADLSVVYSQNGDQGGSLRTGCIGCPLISQDKSLQKFVEIHPIYSELNRIREIYRELSLLKNRLVRPGRNCPGAITLQARIRAFREILTIQDNVQKLDPSFVLIEPEEVQEIAKLLDLGTYPKGYKGDEPSALTLEGKPKHKQTKKDQTLKAS
jgi:DNA sulfur modification protein DndC